MDLSVRRLLCLLALPAVASAGELRGIVLDETGSPLHVVIQAGGQSAHTDGAGSFRLVLPEGAVELHIGDRSAGTVRIPQTGSAEVVAVLDGDGLRVAIEDGAEAAPTVAHIGEVRGRVTDTDGQPVVGAQVFARGVTGEALTDADGAFVFPVPEGSVDLTVLARGFATTGLPGVQAGDDVAIELVPAGMMLDAFTVTAPAVSGGTADLLAERQASATVGDAIGAEQMSRAGDSTAASALRRVTGLTLVGGKYVYVRGLGERYASTLLDGAQLPSPEPERRVVPLDLFPTGMLERVVVQKSYSPDMPGEFGGGVVALDTRRAPEAPFLQFSASTGGDTQSTFRTGLAHDTGPTDFLGIDGGHRSLPKDVAAASSDSPLEEGDRFSDRGYTPEELKQLGQSMPNRWNLGARSLIPDVGLTVSAGTRVETGLGTLGLLAGTTWSHAWNHDTVQREYILVGGDGDIEVAHRYDFTTTTRDVRLGGLAAITLDTASTQWTLTSLLARSTDDEARVYEGRNRDVGGDIRVSRSRFVARQLWSTRLGAEHQVSDAVDLSWRATVSRADRLEPDRREVRFDNEIGTDVWRLSDRPEGNQRVFSDLTDWGVDVAGNVGVQVGAVRLSSGVQGVRKSRGVDTRRFKFIHKGLGSRDQDLLAQDPETIFDPQNIGPDAFQFEEITRATDNYTASQTIGAAYAMADAELGQTRILAGARVESSDQVVETFQLFNPDPNPVVARLNTVDILPALTVTQGLFGDDMQLRLGYGRTVNRPDFRELSPATFNDVTGGRQTFGNADLDRALIDHLDARWELYPSDGESVSIGVFGKRFTNPIEQVVVVSAQHSVTYANVDGATNIGVELEWRKHLGFVAPALESITLAGNVALIRSRVQLGDTGGIETSQERALQGQSPYAINLQVGWAHPNNGSSLTALYNAVGARITEVGALGAPDALERPAGRLDVVGRVALGERWGLSLKAQNLTDGLTVTEQGGVQTSRDRDGVAFGVGVNGRFGG